MLEQSLARTRMQLRRKRYRGVLSTTSDGLERYPENPDFHAFRAVALAELGDYPSALMRLSDATGAQEATVMSVVAAADVARFFGAAGEAVALRTQLLSSGDSPHRELVMMMKLFVDHFHDANLEGMWDAATTAMALNPNSAVPYALMARYYTALGDEEEAASYLWLVQMRGGRTASEAIAQVEFALAFERPEDAAYAADEYLEMVLRSKEFAVARGRALIASESYDDALILCDLRSWHLADELWHPGLLGVRAMAYAGLGWMDAAADEAARLRRTYPRLELSAEVDRFVDQRTRR